MATLTIEKLKEFGHIKLDEFVAKKVKVLAATKRIAVFTVAHFMLLGGFAAIAYGCWMIWHPLGFIVGGWLGIRIAVMANPD